MSIARLDGCRPAPLGSYLQALGTWSAVTRTISPEATARWAGGRMVLEGAGDLDSVIDTLLDRFSPLPVISPWNAGSGFAGNGKSATAERLLERVRASTDARAGPLRDAVTAGDRVVAEGQRRGWGGDGTDLWDKTRKAEVVQLCRNLVADDAVPWIDAAVVLADDVTYSRLLGTGGNFGRQDLSVSYLTHAMTIIDGSPEKSRAWLVAALTGDESVPYLRGTVGQFDPGRAGGVQSSPSEDNTTDGFVNPWSTVLSIEGALLFTPTVGRRSGAATSRMAVPFLVNGTSSGFVGSAADEDVSAEIWTPTWVRPATLNEVRQLIREGRAEWNSRPARSGMDFALAVRSLGVDRGIDSFTRHVIVNRLGQNPLAVAVGDVAVPRQDAVDDLRGIDSWLQRLRWADKLPRAVTSALRMADDLLMVVSRSPEDGPLRVEMLRHLGLLHRLVERSSKARAAVPPLIIRSPGSWLSRARGDEIELRLAAAFASARDAGTKGAAGLVRLGISTVSHSPNGNVVWTGRPCPVDIGCGAIDALAESHVRRAAAPPAEAPGPLKPAVKGIYTGPASGWWAHVDDIVALVEQDIDDLRFQELLDGLMLFDWRSAPAIAFDRPAPRRRVPEALALLLPFASIEPLPLAQHPETGNARMALFRASPSWPALLRAERLTDVLDNASYRLRVGGVTGTPNRAALGRRSGDGTRLSAALLAPMNPLHRIAAARSVVVVPPQPYPITTDREN